MITIPKKLCELACLPENSTATDLLEIIKSGNHDFMDGLLESEDSLEAATQSLEQFSNYRLRIEAQVGHPQYKHCRINIDGSPAQVLIGLISDDEIDAPPTDLEILIFWISIDNNLSWHSSKQIAPGSNRLDWRSYVKGKAIIAEPQALTSKTEQQQMISALFGLTSPSIPATVLPPPLAEQATVITISDDLASYTTTQSRLLFEATTIHHPKWRFLSLYRILENAYLARIKQVLLSAFDKDATKAVDEAKSSLSSEVSQLINLAKHASLTTEFEVFNLEFENLKTGNNRYIHALDKSASSNNNPLYKDQNIYKKAVARFYKIRCSIAHAGTSDIIYEQFPDADQAILALLPSIEGISLKSLKITAS